MVNVKITHNNKTIKTVSLVDSGATSNFIPRGLAEILELDLSTKPKDAVGAGGKFPNIPTKMDKVMLIKGANSVYEEFTNLGIYVPSDYNAVPYMVLGRDSIFRRFTIKFLENQEKFVLKRTKRMSR